MSDVEKRPILVARCLNNLYGCYESLQSFFNFLKIIKQQKGNKKVHKIIYPKFSKKKGKRNSTRFWIRPYFRMSQESFEKLCTELRPYIQKNKTKF